MLMDLMGSFSRLSLLAVLICLWNDMLLPPFIDVGAQVAFFMGTSANATCVPLLLAKDERCALSLRATLDPRLDRLSNSRMHILILIFKHLPGASTKAYMGQLR